MGNLQQNTAAFGCDQDGCVSSPHSLRLNRVEKEVERGYKITNSAERNVDWSTLYVDSYSFLLLHLFTGFGCKSSTKESW